MNQKTLVGAICLSLAAAIWGGMYVVSKYVLDFIAPLTLVWLRYGIAFVVLQCCLSITQRRSPAAMPPRDKRDWLRIGWIGFIGYFVSISFQFMGTKLSDAHTAALLTATTPAFMVVFARLILNEALTSRKIISLSLATLGVVMIIGWDAGVGAHFKGNLLLVGAAVTWSLLSVSVKVASRRQPSLVITTYGILFALTFTTPLMIWELQTNHLLVNEVFVVLGILYLGIVSTAGAFWLWNKGLSLMDAGPGSLFFFFQPVVGSLLGWWLLGENLGWNFLLGGLFILGAVGLTTIGTHSET